MACARFLHFELQEEALHPYIEAGQVVHLYIHALKQLSQIDYFEEVDVAFHHFTSVGPGVQGLGYWYTQHISHPCMLFCSVHAFIHAVRIAPNGNHPVAALTCSM